MKTLLSTRYTFAALPKDYGELCRNILLPRPIRDRSHYRETLAVTDAMAGHRMNLDQADYFELLCDLIESWERNHGSRLPAATPLETVLHLMEANSMTGADLGRLLGVSRSSASRILSGERQLTPAHIVTLSRRFRLQHESLRQPIGERRHVSSANARQSSIRAGPDGSIRRFGQTGNIVSGDGERAVVLLRKQFEGAPIEPRQTVLGADPQIAIARLEQALHAIARQPVLRGVAPVTELLHGAAHHVRAPINLPARHRCEAHGAAPGRARH